jgi:hypothetical protein
MIYIMHLYYCIFFLFSDLSFDLFGDFAHRVPYGGTMSPPSSLVLFVVGEVEVFNFVNLISLEKKGGTRRVVTGRRM